MPDNYTEEFQTLKAQLNHALSKLGIESVCNNKSESVINGKIAHSVVENTTTPIIKQTRSSSENDTISLGWKTREIMEELASTTKRRRELELELVSQMRQEEKNYQQQQQRHQQHKQQQFNIRNAITSLQRQRLEIMRELELERKEALQDNMTQDNCERSSREIDVEQPIRATSDEQQDILPTTKAAVRRCNDGTEMLSESKYAIEGVLTRLEPMVMGSQITANNQYYRNNTAKSAKHNFPPGLHRHDFYSHDTLTEVFNIQLKFAETMLKLEKSLHSRNQLLEVNQNESSCWINQGCNQRTRQSLQSDDEDEELMFSNDGALSDQNCCSPPQCKSFRQSKKEERNAQSTSERTPSASSNPALTQATPSTEGSNTTVSIITPNSDAQETNTPTSSIPVFDSTPQESQAQTPMERHHDNEGEMYTTTPLATTNGKQVRFYDQDNEYATPLVARNIRFEHDSDDEDDDIQTDDVNNENELSFLRGSCVSSTELNDGSFLQSFEEFRRELQCSNSFKGNFFSASSVGLARNPFSQEEPQTTLKSESKEDTIQLEHTTCQSTDKSCQEKRRQLCLDIQEQSARLALAQDLSPSQVNAIEIRLQSLRRELQTLP